MYEKKKNPNQNESKTTKEDMINVVMKSIVKIHTEHVMNRFGDDADAMLGWLAHRAGNQEPINGHRLDNLKMTVDNDRLTLAYPDVHCYIVVDDGKLTVENLRQAVRAVIEHDQETLWKISCKNADEMADEDDED